MSIASLHMKSRKWSKRMNRNVAKSLSISSYLTFFFTFNNSSSFLKLLSPSKGRIDNILFISTCSIFDQFLYNPCLSPKRRFFPVKPGLYILVKTLIPSPYTHSHKSSIHLHISTWIPSTISLSHPVLINGSVVRIF